MKPLIKRRDVLPPRIHTKPGGCPIAYNCPQGGCFLIPNYPSTPQFGQQRARKQRPREDFNSESEDSFLFNSAFPWTVS